MKNKHKLFESYRISYYPGFNEKQTQTIRIVSNIRLPRIQWKTNTNYSNRIEYQITQDTFKNKHKLFESYRISDYPGFNEKQTQTIRIV